MKVYAVPKEVPKYEPDYANYDRDVEEWREEQHKDALKAYLRKMGYTGKYTGEVVYFPFADGAAAYMVAHGSTAAKSFLVHLPYGDHWHDPNVKFVPFTEIIKRIEQSKKLTSMILKKAG